MESALQLVLQKAKTNNESLAKLFEMISSTIKRIKGEHLTAIGEAEKKFKSAQEQHDMAQKQHATAQQELQSARDELAAANLQTQKNSETAQKQHATAQQELQSAQEQLQAAREQLKRTEEELQIEKLKLTGVDNLINQIQTMITQTEEMIRDAQVNPNFIEYPPGMSGGKSMKRKRHHKKHLKGKSRKIRNKKHKSK